VLSEYCANQATPSSTISNSNTALPLWLGAVFEDRLFPQHRQQPVVADNLPGPCGSGFEPNRHHYRCTENRNGRSVAVAMYRVVHTFLSGDSLGKVQ